MSGFGQARRPEQIWLLVGAVLLLTALVLAAAKVVAVHRSAASRLAQVEPRFARMAGLLQNSDRLATSDKAVAASMARFLYPAEGDPGQIGNQTLQRVRDLASARSLRVASSQVAAPREDQGFDRIALSMRVEGHWDQMQALLTELARQQPAIYSQTVQINTQGAAMVGHKVTVVCQLELYVLKERRQ